MAWTQSSHSISGIFLAESLLEKFSGRGLVPDAVVNSESFLLVVAAAAGLTVLLATIPNLLGLGRSAEMTYYETPAGAKVFAAGTLNFAASSDEPAVSRLLENLWARLSKP